MTVNSPVHSVAKLLAYHDWPQATDEERRAWAEKYWLAKVPLAQEIVKCVQAHVPIRFGDGHGEGTTERTK